MIVDNHLKFIKVTVMYRNTNMG